MLDMRRRASKMSGIPRVSRAPARHCQGASHACAQQKLPRFHLPAQFLKSSGMALAGTAIFGEIAARSYAGHDSTIKVALVGCGFRGTGAATQVLSTKGPVKLWAMADLFQDRLEASYGHLVHGIEADYDREGSAGFAARIDVPPERRFVGFDAYQKAIDSGVDMVLLTTNQHFRPAHFAYAVQRGKHVFMEKPLGVDVPGIQQLLAANEEAKEKNLKVGVGLACATPATCKRPSAE